MIELVSERMLNIQSLKHSLMQSLFFGTGTRIRTLIKGFGDLYSTVELFPWIKLANQHRSQLANFYIIA